MNLTKDPATNQLSELFSVRNAIQQCGDFTELLRTCVSLARSHTRAQTAAIFLFSKDGFLERRSLEGVDKGGLPIPGDWFSSERHALGASFTGKVPIPVPPSPFGLPQWISNFRHQQIDKTSREAYEDMLGFLGCAAAVPLNGRHRTFGVLEVINKVDDTGRSVPGVQFKKSEIFWLSLIGVMTAAAITILKGMQERSLLRHISQVIARPFFSEDDDPGATYQEIANDLTGPLMSYKACLIRVGPALDSLDLVARGGSQVDWRNRQNGSRSVDTVVGKVFSTGKREIIETIDSRFKEFVNRDWITANRFRSCACFPLKVQDQVLGTLSLFTGYRHAFDDTELQFIDSIALLLGSLADACSRRKLTELQLADEHSRFVSVARLAAHNAIVDDLRHSQKQKLQNLQNALVEVSPDVGGRARKILERVIADIESELHSVLEGFSTAGHARLRLNDVVQGVARSFSREARQKRITLTVTVDKQLPDIEASEVEIKDLIWNLITNAIKAIETAGRKNGSITVTTAQDSYEHREIIEITVEDDGIGIRKEIEDEIFKRGFTTYPGGSGFGLFSVQRTVDKYGGKVIVESTLGKGSKFSIRLPLQPLRMD